MANPAADYVVVEPTSFEVSGTTVVANLDPDRDYTLLHTGIDMNGDSTVAVVRIGVNVDEAPADFSGGTQRIPLPAGVGVPIGPKISKLAMEAADDVLVSIIPGPNYMGRC